MVLCCPVLHTKLVVGLGWGCLPEPLSRGQWMFHHAFMVWHLAGRGLLRKSVSHGTCGRAGVLVLALVPPHATGTIWARSTLFIRYLDLGYGIYKLFLAGGGLHQHISSRHSSKHKCYAIFPSPLTLFLLLQSEFHIWHLFSPGYNPKQLHGVCGNFSLTGVVVPLERDMLYGAWGGAQPRLA